MKFNDYTILTHKTNDEYNTIVFIVMKDSKIVYEMTFNNGGWILEFGQQVNLISTEVSIAISHFITDNYKELTGEAIK